MNPLTNLSSCELLPSLPNLAELVITRAGLTEFPVFVLRLHQLALLDLSDNKISGSIPASEMCTSLPNLNSNGFYRCSF